MGLLVLKMNKEKFKKTLKNIGLNMIISFIIVIMVSILDIIGFVIFRTFIFKMNLIRMDIIFMGLWIVLNQWDMMGEE